MIGTMVYSFARVGAAVTVKAGDYFQHRKRWWFRLHEQGGKRHEVPCHHSLDEYLEPGLLLPTSAMTTSECCSGAAKRATG